jgi:hypothetical protein
MVRMPDRGLYPVRALYEYRCSLSSLTVRVCHKESWQSRDVFRVFIEALEDTTVLHFFEYIHEVVISELRI